MPILASDIKLLKSATMADVPEGGGAPTGTPVQDGVSNDIFPDISELDRALGRVALRKTFAQVASADTDTYFGVNLIVARPPADPNVCVTLFAGGDAFEQRAGAISRLEAYLARGAEWGGYLFGDHIAGQRVIQLFQRPGAQLPNPNQTLVLVRPGLPSPVVQYVRATRVTSQERTFTHTLGGSVVDYPAVVVTIDISDALRTDFPGSPASRLFARDTNAGTQVCDTVVADAGSYAGVVPLTQSAGVGDFTVQADGIYTQLVPSAQTEVPMAALSPWGDLSVPLPAESDVSYTTAQAWTTATALQLPGGCLPGSLHIAGPSGAITDAGGRLMLAGSQIGTIDYANGTCTLLTGSQSGSKDVTYRPAAQVLRQPQSASFDVRIESRSLSYVGTITPAPAPGTLAVHYLVASRWYVLRDDGSGTLRGQDAGQGAGTYNAALGSFVVTLGALPDVGSRVILAWGSRNAELSAAPHTAVAAQRTRLPNNNGIDPGSLTLTWTTGGTVKTATANAQGQLSGDASGRATPEGWLDFVPALMPPADAQIHAEYDEGAAIVDAAATTASGGAWHFSAATTPVIAGSLVATLQVVPDYSTLSPYQQTFIDQYNARVPPTAWRVCDDGAGHLRTEAGALCGTIDYVSGACAITALPSVNALIPAVYGATLPGSDYAAFTWRSFAVVGALGTPLADVNYRSGAGAASATDTDFAWAPRVPLQGAIAAALVPGSVLLRQEGAARIAGDNARGGLRVTDDATGADIDRGTLDYLGATARPAGYADGSPNVWHVLALDIAAGDGLTAQTTFRTATAPLRPGSLTLQFARGDGAVQTFTADLAGVISAAGVAGTVDHQTGVVHLRFGDLIPAAGHETEPWYDPAAVDGDGKIWRPAPVITATLRYSAVAYAYLPLDAALLGIDPVRLPSDGRVPIFRAGGVAVVGHTGAITGPVANSDTVNCGRVRLSRVRVLGSDGAVIQAGYSADLEAGTVTFTDVTGYAQPVTVEHRIEDMAVINDAQISGAISFTRPLTHHYPAHDSHISTALIAGDLFARVQLTFDQQTWGNVWADQVTGNAAVAKFNAAQYPITVTNQGALTERWVLQFTTSTTFNLIGEHVGVIASGNINTDFAPLNPASGTPYFTVPALGWGSGWVAGNVLRINTIGAQFPVWVVRTVRQGPETVPDDSFTLLVRGDVDRP